MINTKEKIYNNIEKLIRKSFEEGTDDIWERVKKENPDADVFTLVNESDYPFKSEYLVRSKCFFSINHLLQYIKEEIDKA